MSLRDSALDAEAMGRARRLLAGSPSRDPAWPALVAAAALALTSVIFATVMVLAPPLERHTAARTAPV